MLANGARISIQGTSELFLVVTSLLGQMKEKKIAKQH